MKLEDIGFYTLSEERAKSASHLTPLKRCELVLTARCNFRCPYCRRVGGEDLSLRVAERWISLWAKQGCSALRLSGGEPTVYPYLTHLVQFAHDHGIARIAVSTNGSASRELYNDLLAAGANDFSVSLDACCAADGDKMGMRGAFDTVIKNIKWLASCTYVTVGVVLTDDNAHRVNEIIKFASDLGVDDIRVIPAAQDGERLRDIKVDQELLDKHLILAYRVANLQAECPVRGISEKDTHRCGLVLDDVAACGDEHFPCIIYMRERGKPIGKIGPDMRKERAKWYAQHDTHTDLICRKNCLDVCVGYNLAHAKYHCDPIIDDPIEPGMVIDSEAAHNWYEKNFPKKK